MIELIVNGIHLPVKQAPLAFRFKSPILHKQDGSIIYNLEIPINPVSREIFGFIDRLESKSFGNQTPVIGELKVFGVPLGNVALEVTKITNADYQCVAGVQRGFMNGILSSENLKDYLRSVEFHLPEGNSFRKQLFQASCLSLVDSLPFITFMVQNPDAFSGDENAWPMNPASKEVFVWQNAFNITVSMEPLDNYPISPFYKVNYILEEICKKLGYNLVQNDLAKDPELRRLTVWTNNLQFCTGFYAAYASSVWRLGDFMPNMTVIEFVQAIENTFNCKLLFSSKRQEVRLILLDPIFDTSESIDLELPAASISEIDLQRRTSAYRFGFDGSGDAFYAEYVNDYREGEYNFLGTIPNESALPNRYLQKWGDILQSEATGAYYVISVNADSEPTWDFLSLDIIDVLFGEKDHEDYKVKAAPLINTAVNYLTTGQIVDVPNVKIQAVGSFYKGPSVNPGLRLIFYRGIGDSFPGGFDYPYGSSDNRTLNGTPIPGANYGIRWAGEGGLHEKFWPMRLNWMRKGVVPIRCTKKLTMNELSDWDWTVTYKVGQRNALSSIIEGEILPSGVINARLELFPL